MCCNMKHLFETFRTKIQPTFFCKEIQPTFWDRMYLCICIYNEALIDTESVLQEKFVSVVENNTRLEHQLTALSTSFLSLKVQ